MPKTLFLHVGPYKTGTTSIQRTIYNCKEDFTREARIGYLKDKPSHGPALRNVFSDNPLKYNNNKRMAVTNEQIQVNNKKFKAYLTSVFESNEIDFLISGEHVSDLSVDELIKMRDFFSLYFDLIIILYYVRDPNRLIYSDAQEAVKNGRDISGFKFKYIPLRYMSNIKNLYSVFGKDFVRVLNFEDGVKYEKGFTNYFIAKGLGKKFEVDVKDEIKTNESISSASFEFLSLFNSLYPEHFNGKINVDRNINLFNVLKSISAPKNNKNIKLDDDVYKDLVSSLVWLNNEGIANYNYENGRGQEFSGEQMELIARLFTHLNKEI